MPKNDLHIDRSGEMPSHFSEKRKVSLPLILCLSVPSFLLTAAYLKMCFFYQKGWLFGTIVHENGRYTLLQTIFYFRHFCWELLGKAVYAFYIVGAFYLYGKPRTPNDDRVKGKIHRTGILLSGLFVLGIVMLAILLTAHQVGWKETGMGIAQFRTSEVKPIAFGAHWRNHLLSNIVLFSASSFVVLLYRGVYCKSHLSKRRFANLFFLAIGIFAALTFVFGVNIDPFRTPGYLGHQLREIFGSDLPVVMLLSLAVLIYLEDKYDSDKTNHLLRIKTDRKYVTSHLLGWSLPLILIPAFLIQKVLALDISGEMAGLPGAKDWSVLDLFAWHFYEHSLDYLFVVSLVYFLYLLTLRMECGKAVHEA